jgi:hypothetical protein
VIGNENEGSCYEFIFIILINVVVLTWMSMLIVFLNIIFIVQIEDVATKMFDTIVKKDNLVLAMDSPQEPEVLSKYIEGWRIQLWDHAFLSNFKGHDVFKKLDLFLKHKGSDLVVKRVLFRYQFI